MDEKKIDLVDKDVKLELYALYDKDGMRVSDIQQAFTALYLVKKKEKRE